MNSLIDRFRRWFDYERDCNAKALDMLGSVPDVGRSTPEFQKAVDRLAHLVSARRIWLHRLGHLPEAPRLFPKETRLGDLAPMIAETEQLWVDYLAQLDDQALAREIDVVRPDGNTYRWNLEEVLTQLFGHAWYHRGQIAQLVAAAGGKPIDTDFIFWCRPNPIAPAG